MIPSFLAPAVAAPAVVGVVLLIAGRGRTRRVGSALAAAGVLALGGVALLVDPAADCEARGGTLVTGPPIRIEGRRGSDSFSIDRCVLPPR